MKDMARMEHWFGLIASFIGRICVAAFLAGLSSTPVVENKERNNFLECYRHSHLSPVMGAEAQNEDPRWPHFGVG